MQLRNGGFTSVLHYFETGLQSTRSFSHWVSGSAMSEGGKQDVTKDGGRMGKERRGEGEEVSVRDVEEGKESVEERGEAQEPPLPGERGQVTRSLM